MNTIKLYIQEFDERLCKFWFALYPVNDLVLKTIKSLKSEQYRYNDGLKIWLIDFEIYESFVNLLDPYNNNLNIDEIPKFLVKGLMGFLKNSNLFLSDPTVNITESMSKKLLPFQLEGIKFVIKRNGRALIGDEMGCGKTLQAVALLQHYRELWPALILVPPNLLEQWVYHFFKKLES